MTKQMNDPLVVYYRKESKVFNRDMKILFREIYCDILKTYFSIFKILFLSYIFGWRFCKWLCSCEMLTTRLKARVREDILQLCRRCCNSGTSPVTHPWLPLSKTCMRDGLSVFENDTEFFSKNKM